MNTKKGNLCITNRINSWHKGHTWKELILVHFLRWASSKVILHFSRLNNKKMACPKKKKCVSLKIDWETELSWCAFNYYPAAISLALHTPTEGDRGRSITSRDLYISLLFGTHWLTTPISHPPPFDAHIQDDCFLGYLSGYVSLVELVSLDPIKTVLQWYKHNPFEIQ